MSIFGWWWKLQPDWLKKRCKKFVEEKEMKTRLTWSLDSNFWSIVRKIWLIERINRNYQFRGTSQKFGINLTVFCSFGSENDRDKKKAKKQLLVAHRLNVRADWISGIEIITKLYSRLRGDRIFVTEDNKSYLHSGHDEHDPKVWATYITLSFFLSSQ